MLCKCLLVHKYARDNLKNQQKENDSGGNPSLSTVVGLYKHAHARYAGLTISITKLPFCRSCKQEVVQFLMCKNSFLLRQLPFHILVCTTT